MIVEQLGLKDFRNYAEADVSLSPGANVFVGRNGQGKTNLVEAVAYLATLGSHRVSNDAPLVRDGTDAAIVRARLAHGERSVLLELQLNRQGANKARVNGVNVRTSELPRYAQVVLFAPEDLQIVRGDPSARRRFADQLIVQRTPRMAAVLGDYDRVLRQRSALLKSARARGLRGDALSTLDVWDDKLVTLGTEVIEARSALASDLSDPVAGRTPRSPAPITNRACRGRSRSAGATPKRATRSMVRARASRWPTSSARPSPRSDRPSSSADSRWSDPIATTSCCACAACR